MGKGERGKRQMIEIQYGLANPGLRRSLGDHAWVHASGTRGPTSERIRAANILQSWKKKNWIIIFSLTCATCKDRIAVNYPTAWPPGVVAPCREWGEGRNTACLFVGSWKCRWRSPKMFWVLARVSQGFFSFRGWGSWDSALARKVVCFLVKKGQRCLSLIN